MAFSRPRYNHKARAHRSENQNKPTKSDSQYPGIHSPAHHEELESNQEPITITSQIPTEETQNTGDMSKKKRKRFEAYVQKKLKKERRNLLIEELEKTQASVMDSSALISTAHLSSSSISRTQRELKAAALEIESRRRERAQCIISSKQKLRSGYHSQSDPEDESAPISTVNPFSGALEVCNAPPESPRKLPESSSSKKPSDCKITTTPSQVVLGSALASGATTIHLDRPAKKKKTLQNAGRNLEDSAEASSDDLDSEESIKNGSTQSSSSVNSSCNLSDAEDNLSDEEDFLSDEEEWTGCQNILPLEASPLDKDITHNIVLSDSSTQILPRVKGSIRDWANLQLQLSESKDSTEIMKPNSETQAERSTHSTVTTLSLPTPPKHPQSRCGPLGAPLDLPVTPLFLHQKTDHVSLERSEEVIASRSLLPVFAEEHRVMDAIRRHAVVVICGETGSGKTTQVPQFLYEAGWGQDTSDNPGLIGVTQPRRVAAVSMARRVEAEMGLSGRGIVSHQIRYDSSVSPTTKIKFMTDGIILRELAADFLLSKYSAIIVDEAHERSINTDVLIGVLSRIVNLRMKTWMERISRNSSDGASTENKYHSTVQADICHQPLRLIIMSATLRVSDFTLNSSLFPEPPPVIEIAARQFPVAIHFMRKTPVDYVNEAFVKAAKIHARLPPGGILIFLTGQLEITKLCRKLEQKFGKKSIEQKKTRIAALQTSRYTSSCSQFASSPAGQLTSGDLDASQDLVPSAVYQSLTSGEVELINLGKDNHEFAPDVDEGQEWEEDPEALDTDEEDELVVEGVELVEDSDLPMHILPLYSLLPTNEQMRVFEQPPAGSRLVVVATNVAETSLTIPNIRYVIDCGRAKERHYDLSTGIQSFEIDWISKASASQRAGRAGRTAPGHCYRLYSSALYENYFPQFAKPEIQRMPIDGIVLQMKSMNIDTVTNFPFPTPPDRHALRKSETSLAHLGALSLKQAPNDWLTNGELAGQGTITPLGRAMARYPLIPRFARMLVSGFRYDCLPYVVALVAILSVGDPFIHETAIDEDNPSDYLDEQAFNEIEGIKSADVKDREIRRQKRRQFFKVRQQFASLGNGVSDLFKILAVVGAYEYGDGNSPTQFCRENFVRPKAMEEIHQLRAQITRIVQATTIETGLKIDFSPKLMPPSETQLKVLRQLITSSFIDQVAVKATKIKSSQSISKRSNEHNHNRHLTAYRTIGTEEDVFVHPSSILFNSTTHPSPDFIVFQELHRTEKRVWIKGITAINPSWLPILGKSLCSFSKPAENSSQLKLAAPASSKEDGLERKCLVVPKFGGPKLDVELSPIQMTQRQVGSHWVWV